MFQHPSYLKAWYICSLSTGRQKKEQQILPPNLKRHLKEKRRQMAVIRGFTQPGLIPIRNNDGVFVFFLNSSHKKLLLELWFCLVELFGIPVDFILIGFTFNSLSKACYCKFDKYHSNKAFLRVNRHQDEMY